MRVFILIAFLFTSMISLSQDAVIWREIEMRDIVLSLNSSIEDIKDICVQKMENQYALKEEAFSYAQTISLKTEDDLIKAIIFTYDTTYRYDGSVDQFNEQFRIKGQERKVSANGVTHHSTTWSDDHSRFTIAEEKGGATYRFYSILETLD